MRLTLNNYLFGLTSSLMLFLGACSDTTLGTFSVVEPLPARTIPSLGVQLPLTTALSIPLDVTTQESYDNGDYDYVTSVQILSLTLNIDPASDSDALEDGNLDDFDFLSNLEVYLNATIEGEARTELVASIPDGDPQYSSGLRKLMLTTTNVDVFDYIAAPGGYTMTVRVSGVTPIDNVVVNGSVRYRVGVGFR